MSSSCNGQDYDFNKSLEWLQTHQQELSYQQPTEDNGLKRVVFLFDTFDDPESGITEIDSFFDSSGQFLDVYENKISYEDLEILESFEQIGKYRDSLSQLMILPLPTKPVLIIDPKAIETGNFDKEPKKYGISYIPFGYYDPGNDKNENREEVLMAITHLMSILKGQPVGGMMNAPILESYKRTTDLLSIEMEEDTLLAVLVDFDKIRIYQWGHSLENKSFAFSLPDLKAVPPPVFKSFGRGTSDNDCPGTFFGS